MTFVFMRHRFIPPHDFVPFLLYLLQPTDATRGRNNGIRSRQSYAGGGGGGGGASANGNSAGAGASNAAGAATRTPGVRARYKL